MCPLAEPPPEIDMNWSDEQIISLLYEYTPLSYLPNNVLTDSSPYLYPPSNLPEGIWYLVPSNKNKESVYGFWKANGAACEIFSNSTMIGWRTTLQYFEGQALGEQKRTDWLMQEYWITRKELCDNDKPKESTLLCRVFCTDNSLKSDKHSQNHETAFEAKKIINSVASVDHNTDSTASHDSGSEFVPKRDCEVLASPAVADNKTNSPPQDISELDCFLRGDYLELNDLEDPESHSSSSRNSSCLSKSSDDAFDASAFLRDIEKEYDSTHGQQSSSRYDFTSLRPNDVVLQPTATGSLLTGSVQSEAIEGSRSGSMIHETSTDERVLENTTKRQNPESTTEGTSNRNPESTTEGTSNSAPSREKKAGGAGRKMKKLKMYFCFKPS